MQKTLTLFMFWIINVAVKIPPVSFDWIGFFCAILSFNGAVNKNFW